MSYYAVAVDKLATHKLHPIHGHVIYHTLADRWAMCDDMRIWLLEQDIAHALVCRGGTWELRVGSVKEAALVQLRWGVEE